MKLVIDIDEETYKNVLHQVDDIDSISVDALELEEAIYNGTPLPKGHGRLIDADRLKIDNPLHLSLYIPYVTEDSVEDIIDHAPTIIEADKGE